MIEGSQRTRRVAPTGTPRRALRTVAAADYLGLSPSLLRKYRMRGCDGPPYIAISPYLIVYEIAALDAWLDARKRADHAAA